MNYLSMRTNMVIPLLTKYGKPMTIVRAAPTPTGWVKTFDGGLGSWTWTNSSTGEVVYTDPTAVPVPTTLPTVGVEKPYLQEEIDGTVVIEGDRRFVMAGDVAPLVGDTIQVGSATDVIRVQDVKKISPALVPIAYLVHGRE